MNAAVPATDPAEVLLSGWSMLCVCVCVYVLQCRWDWRPTAAWCRHCMLVSSGKEPACRRSAASCRRMTRGYESPLSPWPSTPPLYPLWGEEEYSLEDLRGFEPELLQTGPSVLYWSMFSWKTATVAYQEAVQCWRRRSWCGLCGSRCSAAFGRTSEDSERDAGTWSAAASHLPCTENIAQLLLAAVCCGRALLC